MSPRDEKVEKYFKEVQKILPGLKYSSISSLYSGEQPSSAKISFSNGADVFKRKFGFNKHKTIIHYTTIDSLCSILNSQSFRLYNCNNLNDPKEIEYANVNFGLGLNQETLNAFKQSFFVSSFCEYDMESKNDDFNLWRLYGNNGYGVGLVFEIENMDDVWSDVYIGKVCYDNSAITEEFKNFFQFHKEFNKKHHLFENVPFLIPAMALHVKDEIWKSENEIRLFTHCQYDQYTLKRCGFEIANPLLDHSIEHTLNKEGQLVSYLKLPINAEAESSKWNRNLSPQELKSLYSTIPHLKLKRVILGYKVSSEAALSLVSIVGRLKEDKGLNNIEIMDSQLRRKF